MINQGLSTTGYALYKDKKISENRNISPENHKKLISHVYNLLVGGSNQRARRIQAMITTESDLLGVASPVGSDCDRAQNRAEGRGAATPDRIYPFGYITLQRYASELASIVMPYETPYSTVTQVNDQDKADAIAKALRHSAAIFDHRNHVHACIFDALALDLFAARVDWRTYGYPKAGNFITQGANLADVSGPVITHLDPYNISYDSSIPPDQVPEFGEFFAEFYMTSKFQLKRMRDYRQRG